MNRTQTISANQILDLKRILELRLQLLQAQESFDFDSLIKTSEEGLDPKHEEFSSSNVTAAAQDELTQRHGNEIREIENAFERMRQGSYSVCVDCQASIDFPRLLAYPTALRCLSCQEGYELIKKRGV